MTLNLIAEGHITGIVIKENFQAYIIYKYIQAYNLYKIIDTTESKMICHLIYCLVGNGINQYRSLYHYYIVVFIKPIIKI